MSETDSLKHGCKINNISVGRAHVVDLLTRGTCADCITLIAFKRRDDIGAGADTRLELEYRRSHSPSSAESPLAQC